MTPAGLLNGCRRCGVRNIRYYIMEEVSKDRVMAAVVSTFFKYFTAGVLESQSTGDPLERYEPRNVKQTMLEHYEKISSVFNSEAFYAIFRMNYDEAEIEAVLRKAVTPTTSAMELVRIACRTEELYQTMVSEYKRNFEQLLCGHIATREENEKNFTRCPSAGKMSRAMAENIINRIAANAYGEGRKAAGAK